MLKEMVDLVAKAKAMNALASTNDSDNIDNSDIEQLTESIEAATEAIGRHDEQKRKSDEAICLLFRAVASMSNLAEREGYNHHVSLVARAESLLGFAQLEPVKS